MKLNKIFATALAILTLTACDDDDPVNTADVTVNMQKTEMQVAEDFSTGVYFYVPVELSGETNGPVTVTVEVEGVGSTPATEDDDYVVTSKTIVIPAGELTGRIEFHATGDSEVNESREFTMTIVAANGAKIGSNATTRVTLFDDDHLLPEAYAKVIGTWSAGEYNVTLSGYPEDDPNYLKKVKMSGLNGDPDLNDVILDFSLDAASGLINLEIKMPQVLAESARFNPPVGVVDIVLLPYDQEGLYLSGAIAATSNEEVTQFVFDGGIAGGLFAPGNHTGGGFAGYVYFRQLSFSLTKVQ